MNWTRALLLGFIAVVPCVVATARPVGGAVANSASTDGCHISTRMRAPGCRLTVAASCSRRSAISIAWTLGAHSAGAHARPPLRVAATLVAGWQARRRRE